jgi:hypothetical protein
MPLRPEGGARKVVCDRMTGGVGSAIVGCQQCCDQSGVRALHGWAADWTPGPGPGADGPVGNDRSGSGPPTTTMRRHISLEVAPQRRQRRRHTVAESTSILGKPQGRREGGRNGRRDSLSPPNVRCLRERGREAAAYKQTEHWTRL